MKDIENITKVITQFMCDADVSSLKNYGSGHINDTYFLKNRNPSGIDYLLQRINHHVFNDVEKLIGNMCLVIYHLKNKVRNEENGNPEKKVLTLIPTVSGHFFYRDNNGDYWRMCYFLNNTKSYDVVETERQAYEGGKAFGKFQTMLSDMPPGIMHETIPHFHNIQKRLEQLNDAIKNDKCGRVKSLATELSAIEKYATSMLYFQQPEQMTRLPKRVIHNDTKFNNVLLDSNDEGQCVIDLDTVMDGYVAYDFGDAIRTIINTAAEDEKDLDKIQLNLRLFGAYTKGYLEEAGQFLTSSEIDSLLMGVLLFPYMQAVRFLTDHINGDTYYKIKFEGHNLQRAYAQFNLFEKLYYNSALLQQLIKKEWDSYKAGRVKEFSKPT